MVMVRGTPPPLWTALPRAAPDGPWSPGRALVPRAGPRPPGGPGRALVPRAGPGPSGGPAQGRGVGVWGRQGGHGPEGEGEGGPGIAAICSQQLLEFE